MKLTLVKHFSLAILTALTSSLALAQEPTLDSVLRTTPTPFGPSKANLEKKETSDSLKLSMPQGQMTLPMAGAIEGPSDNKQIKPIAIGGLSSRLTSHSLSDRLMSTKIFLPEHMVLGKTAEFTIKGKPGALVALAMADKDTGASPIYGHNLRLGADRKVVAIGTINAGGSLNLSVVTPIQGDLVGQYLYFEAAVWTKPDYSDLSIASPVSLSEEKTVNGVLVMEAVEQKKHLKFLPTPTAAPPMRSSTNPIQLDSGQP